ncbi:class I lanthipeptide [Chitinophaga sp. GbtcB8]|uniref:class I lanthipeptide n=1 Tax=Chitinophaga sp. GbtcB8 TaxID=2824753 RepID=UPI001C2FAAA6|nr:class I lanthipeptide [Chitinophaga sp. GbtcB8]
MKKIPSKKLSLSKIRIASLSKDRQQTLKGGSIETFDRNCKTWYVECGTGPFTIARTCVE